MARTIQPTKLFPQPQLQQTPVLDLRAMRAEEDKVLNSYAWVDQPKGVVRIPIDAGHGYFGQARTAGTRAAAASCESRPPRQ